MKITIDISNELEDAARNIAIRTHRKVEDVLQEWLNQFVSQIPVDWLQDGQLLDLVHLKMSDDNQTELSDLLEINNERIMSPTERKRLDELMQLYGKGMVRKAEATKEAVKRGLISPLIG